MKLCSQDITPDSLSGAIFALEGIRDAAVILNGPTGCKFYHSAISDSQFPRGSSFDPLAYPEQFYFGQPRLPATCLDGYDYVYGSADKLEQILPAAAKGHRLAAVVNSPGAALIGDDLKRLAKKALAGLPCVVLESTGFSGYFAEGFQNALLKVLDCIALERRRKIPGSVNLVGISIYHKYFAGSIKEMKRLLEMCGIEVTAVLCAGDRLRDLQNLPEASLNVVLYPEYGLELARRLYERYDTPYLASEEGPPIGFQATEHFLRKVAGSLGADPSPALQALDRARAACFQHLSRFHSLTGLPGGNAFSVKADPSTAYALTNWLSSYLGMIPAAVETTQCGRSEFTGKLAALLAGAGLESTLARPVNATAADLVFADGATIAQLKTRHGNCCGIEIALPSLGYIDVAEKSLFGPSGAMMMVEQILNALRFL